MAVQNPIKMIDFNATQSTPTNIEYVNMDGDVVKTYTLDELRHYVESNSLNVLSVSANGRPQFDPSIIEEEKTQDVEDYIDENWFAVTKSFFNSQNNFGFHAKYTPQQRQNQLR